MSFARSIHTSVTSGPHTGPISARCTADQRNSREAYVHTSPLITQGMSQPTGEEIMITLHSSTSNFQKSFLFLVQPQLQREISCKHSAFFFFFFSCQELQNHQFPTSFNFLLIRLLGEEGHITNPDELVVRGNCRLRCSPQQGAIK